MFTLKKLNGNCDEEIIKGLRVLGGNQQKAAEDAIFYRFSDLINAGIEKYQFSEEEALAAYSNAVLKVVQEVQSEGFSQKYCLRTLFSSLFEQSCKTQQKNHQHVVPVQQFPGRLSTLPLSSRSKELLANLINEEDIALAKENIQSLPPNHYNVLVAWREGFNLKEISRMFSGKNVQRTQTDKLDGIKALLKKMR